MAVWYACWCCPLVSIVQTGLLCVILSTRDNIMLTPSRCSAPCAQRRCMFAVLFSPEENRTADQIVQEELQPWLHMVHTQSPGAQVFLVCSHAESPPLHQPDPSAWREHVERLAKDVEEKVHYEELYTRLGLPAGFQFPTSDSEERGGSIGHASYAHCRGQSRLSLPAPPNQSPAESNSTRHSSYIFQGF
jgi:hypothetical protein